MLYLSDQLINFPINCNFEKPKQAAKLSMFETLIDYEVIFS